MSRLLDVAGARTYARAGVSIEAGDEVVQRIKASVESTYRKGVVGGIGGFGGLFALEAKKYDEPKMCIRDRLDGAAECRLRRQ